MGGGEAMKKYYLMIDVARCENCRNCSLACKDEHVGNDWPGYAAPQPNTGPGWIDIMTAERGQHPMVDVAYLPVPCQHCDDAPCLKAARDGAIYRRPDGIVIIDPVKAKGQKQLVAACPYGAIRWHEELQLPQKCTLCTHLLDAGWQQTRCVQSCPTGALSLHKLEEAEITKLIESEGLAVYKPELKTKPRILYKNIYRFTRCFLGGSISIKVNGREECAEGVQINLYDNTGRKIDECLTDNYGDFKFDNLEPDSGQYTIEVTFPGHESQRREVELTRSRYIGTIVL
jgi:Fe-S-cluster-containing dehydrogenase component